MKKRLLVIDDDPDIQALVTAYLADEYEIKTINFVQNPETMLELYSPELVLLDLKLPNSDGYELCCRLKELSPLLPVILMTGVDLNAVKNNYSKVAADGFLLKPFTEEELKQVIENRSCCAAEAQ